RRAVEEKRRADDEEEVVTRPEEEGEDSDGEQKTPGQLEEERRRLEEIRQGKQAVRNVVEGSGLQAGGENLTTTQLPPHSHVVVHDIDPGPQVPQSVLERGVLSGAHMVTSLGKPDTVLVRELGAKIADALPADTPNRESFGRALAESVFSGTSLRALVSALSRGDVVHIPVGTDAHQGTVTLRGEVAGLVRHSQKAKFEYEGGGDRVVTLGETNGTNRSVGAGIQGRGDFFKVMRAALDAFGLNRDKTRSDEVTTSSKFFSRAKTTEVTEVFRGNLLVDVGYRPKGDRETDARPPRLDPTDAGLLTTPLEVGIPERETRPPAAADIQKNLIGALDPELLRQTRLHSSNIMLDVHVKGAPQVRSAARQVAGASTQLGNLGGLQTDALPTHRQAMVGVVEALRQSIRDEKEVHERTLRERTPEEDAALDEAARRTRADEDKAAAERIARAEEALKFHGSALSDRLVAEFGYRRLQQDFKGLTNGESVIVRVPGTDVWAEVRAGSLEQRLVATTKDTEFNTGAGSIVTRLRRKVVTGFLQLQGGGRIGNDEVNVSTSFGKRWGKDKVVVTGRTLETAVTTKTKENGAVLDGDGYLEVVIHRGDERLGDSVEVPVGFRTLMPQSDLLLHENPAAAEPGPRLLPESAVIRDIGPLGALRDQLEAAGKKQYGSLWPQIRTEVMQVATQPSLASKLGAMSRGDVFELTAFDRDKVTGAFAALADRGIKVTVRATLEDTRLIRRSDAADLSRQNESSSFTTEQRYTSKFDIRQGAVGYAPVRDMPSGQVQLSQEIRVRGGVRSDANDKLYANSKLREQQEVHSGTLKLTVVLEGGGLGREEVNGEVATQFSVKARVPAPATDTPTVLPRNELEAATVVSFKHEENTPGGDRLLRDVRQALEDRFQWRGGISDTLETTLRAELGTAAMQAKLSQLTRGGVLKVPVAGPGWSAEVVVRAALRSAPVVKYEINNGEFEVGTQNRTGHGVMRDIRDRVTGMLGLTGRVQKEQGGSPGVTLTGDYSYRHETSTGGNLQSSGTTVNRAKNVSTAVVSDAVVDYRVEIHGWTGGLIPSTTRLGPITMEAEVITPKLAVPAGAAVRAVPDRIWQDHVLGSSDVVTNVFMPSGRDTGTAATDFGKAVLRGSGDPGEFGGRNVDKWLHGLGRSGLRHKLYDALGPDNLHDQLKAMMSGRELVVSDGGATIRIGASVKRLAHTGNTTTTEFNTGTQVEHGHSAADGATGGGTGSSHQIRGGVAVSTGMFYAGDTLAVSSSNSTRETWSNRGGSGNTTKVKPEGNVFTGEANLHFSVEWRDLVSSEGRMVLVTKRAYFRRDLGMDVVIDVAETRENVPGHPADAPDKEFNAATAPRGADLRRALTDELPVVEETPAPAAQVPPARVWTHGLVDTDVVRAAGMSPHARQQLTAGAEAFLGSGNWDRIRGMVEGMIDPVALAARLVTPQTPHTDHTPDGTANPAPDGGAVPPRPGEPVIKDGPGNSTLLVGRTDLAGDVRVEVRMKVKELEFIKTDTRTESNPTNTTSVTDGVRAQRAVRVANRVTGGAVSPDTFGFGAATLRGGIYVDTALEHRTDIETVAGGQLVNNAKIATTTARYRGFVEVEVVYHKDGKTLPRRELMAVEIDIPVADTGKADVPHNAFLRFNEAAQNGELRLHGAPKEALPSVARALGLNVGEPEHHAQLLGIGHVARKLLPESLSASGPRAERWLQGLDRLIALAGNGEAGAPFDRLRDAAGRQSVPLVERRRLQDLVELAGADPALSGADLNTHWENLTQRQAEQERQQRMRAQLEQGGPQPEGGHPLLPPSERRPDLSLHQRTVPDLRLNVAAGNARSMNDLVQQFLTTVLQEEVIRTRAPREDGDTRPPVVEITLDVPAARALHEARALEQRLRELAPGLEHEVDVVIVATTTAVPRADRVQVGDAAGAVSSFRIGTRPPGTEANTTVRRDPVNDGGVEETVLPQEPGRNLAQDLNQEVNLTQDLNQEVNPTRDLSQEVNLTQDLNQEVNPTRDLSQEVNLTQDLNQEVNPTRDLSQEVNLTQDLSQEVNPTRDLNQEVNLTQDLSQEVNPTRDNQNVSTEPGLLPGAVAGGPVLDVPPLRRRASSEDLTNDTARDTTGDTDTRETANHMSQALPFESSFSEPVETFNDVPEAQANHTWLYGPRSRRQVPEFPPLQLRNDGSEDLASETSSSRSATPDPNLNPNLNPNPNADVFTAGPLPSMSDFSRRFQPGPAGTSRRPTWDEASASSSSSRRESSVEEQPVLPVEEGGGPLNPEPPAQMLNPERPETPMRPETPELVEHLDESEQVVDLEQLPPVPAGRLTDHVSDASLSSRSSLRSDSSDDSMVTATPWQVDTTTFYQHDGRRLGDGSDNVSVDSDLLDLPVAHERDGTGATWRTARLYEGEEDLYQHPGRRLGDDSDNVSVDSDFLDSASEFSDSSWVEVQPPPPPVQPPVVTAPAGNAPVGNAPSGSVPNGNSPVGSTATPPNTSRPLPPLPPQEAGGPPRIEVPEPLPSLEESVFATLTLLHGDGGEGA
ncbi:hypothetical protein ACFCX4_02180, partial [Kitasatospora sp. NPDC056327]